VTVPGTSELQSFKTGRPSLIALCSSPPRLGLADGDSQGPSSVEEGMSQYSQYSLFLSLFNLPSLVDIGSLWPDISLSKQTNHLQ
jgi:hypothetical protein